MCGGVDDSTLDIENHDSKNVAQLEALLKSKEDEIRQLTATLDAARERERLLMNEQVLISTTARCQTIPSGCHLNGELWEDSRERLRNLEKLYEHFIHDWELEGIAEETARAGVDNCMEVRMEEFLQGKPLEMVRLHRNGMQSVRKPHCLKTPFAEPERDILPKDCSFMDLLRAIVWHLAESQQRHLERLVASVRFPKATFGIRPIMSFPEWMIMVLRRVIVQNYYRDSMAQHKDEACFMLVAHSPAGPLNQLLSEYQCRGFDFLFDKITSWAHTSFGQAYYAELQHALLKEARTANESGGVGINMSTPANGKRAGDSDGLRNHKRPRDEETRTCRICRKQGHVSHHCPQNESAGGQRGKSGHGPRRGRRGKNNKQPS
jgi:hypothetical protein